MWRLTWRNLAARKVRLVMSTLAIVLGVAFLAGVLTFSHGLSATFDSIVKGSTPDGVVRPASSSAFDDGMAGVNVATLSPADVRALDALPETAEVAGNVDGFGMSLLDTDGKLVGGQGAPTIVTSHHEIENVLGEPTMTLSTGEWPDQPGEVTLDARSARIAGYELGEEVDMIAPTGVLRRQATLVGTADFYGGGTAGATLLIMSVEGAQQTFLGGRDAFTGASLTAAPGVTQQQLADAAQAVLPADFKALTGDKVIEESEDAIGEFLDIISTFLLVFAVIAVVVGAFIIVNTFSILVAQRMRDLALLRALGASRRQVSRSVLLEALVMSLVACVVGVLVGWGLALGLAALFRFVGLDIASSALVLTPGTVLVSFAVGVAVTMVAAYVPARRAGRVSPVAAMRDDVQVRGTSLHRRTVIGAAFLVLGAAAAAYGVAGAPGNDAAWIGAGALVWVLTVAAISSVIGRPVLLGCRALFRRLFGTPGLLASENALRDPRRTGATASALMIGLALVSTIGVLAGSFSKSVTDVVDEEFTSDFLVVGSTYQPFSTRIGDEMAAVDGVGVVSRQQNVGVGDASITSESSLVNAVDDAFHQIYELDMVAGRQHLDGHEVIIDADVAADRGLGVGDPMTLDFRAGAPQEVTVVGIFEPTLLTNPVTTHLSVVEAAGIQRQDSSLSINVASGADVAAVHATLDEVVADLPLVSVQDKAELADSIRGQVNQLLYMVYGLLALAIVIAVIGIINTLGLSVIERTRELGLLRAVGLTRPQLRRMVTLESVTIAVLGAVLGLVLGLVFGALLRYALRDDLTSLALPVGQLTGFLVLAVVVGVLAAILPAVRASRLDVLKAIATE
ncbi:ABC transporter permease [Nocardioides gansuensis]|uniref:ABC transporter permease n=1 Tax=Nocardioides gansuensis TaxID=2138300 RepID=A0A2T8FB42_9ACTN|nr:ABC transporter permease [Nocardioides gansuensis]PVG82913.1 ABC transporter permease [Nocardioides gansuensis]